MGKVVIWNDMEWEQLGDGIYYPKSYVDYLRKQPKLKPKKNTKTAVANAGGN